MDTEEIKKLYALDERDESYDSDLDRYRKRIDVVRKKLNLVDEAQLILVMQWLRSHSEDTTLKQLTSKARTQSEYKVTILDLYTKQAAYYYEFLKQSFYHSAVRTNLSISDVDIELTENEYKHLHNWNSDLKIEDFNPLENSLQEKILGRITEYNNDLNIFIDGTLNLIHGSDKKIEFKSIIEESIGIYLETKSNYASTNLQKLNPYLKIYHYIRGVYINSFHSLNLPNDSYFDDFHIRQISIPQKDKYTMKELSFVLSQLLNGLDTPSQIDVDRAYDRLKKFFKKYPELKKDSFSSLYTPLAQYMFLRRKNNNLQTDHDREVIQRIELMLRVGLGNQTKEFDALFEYTNFIKKEFEEIMNVQCHCYQDRMLEFWFHTIVSIYYRTFGLSKELVYSNYGIGSIGN